MKTKIKINSLAKGVSMLTLMLAFGISTQSAKAQVFEEGVSITTLGYGFPNFSGVWLNVWALDNESASQSSFGPLHLKYEYGITDKLGIGASVNLSTTKVTNPYTRTVYNPSKGTSTDVDYEEIVRFRSINALIRLNYHFLDHDKVDFYSGLGVGFNKNSFKFESTDPDTDVDSELDDLNLLVNVIPIGYEATLGLRYLFSDNVGAYIELGWAKSLFQVGLTVKL